MSRSKPRHRLSSCYVDARTGALLVLGKMEIRKSIEEWIASRPNAKLCLHNGFAGFCWGCPSNPIFLDKDYAIKIIEKVIETEHKSLKELLHLDTVINKYRKSIPYISRNRKNWL